MPRRVYLDHETPLGRSLPCEMNPLFGSVHLQIPARTQATAHSLVSPFRGKTIYGYRVHTSSSERILLPILRGRESELMSGERILRFAADVGNVARNRCSSTSTKEPMRTLCQVPRLDRPFNTPAFSSDLVVISSFPLELWERALFQPVTPEPGSCF